MRSREELIEVMARASISTYGLDWDEEVHSGKDQIILEMKAILTALEAAGCEVVPREATEEMIDAADEPFHEELQKAGRKAADLNRPLALASGCFSGKIYTAMLSVHPFRAKE